MIPRTPKERADDLKAIGATIEKLPSFKRSEFRVLCPRCAGVAVWDGKAHRFAKPEHVETMKRNFKNDRIDRINLDDETWHKGGTWERTFHGRDKWLALRVHVLTCSDGGLDDDARRWAVKYAHEIVRRMREAPEVAGLVLAELALTLEDWRTTAPGPDDVFEAGLHVDVAARTLALAAKDLIAYPLAHLPSATREARAAEKAASDERMRATTAMLLADLPRAVEEAGARSARRRK